MGVPAYTIMVVCMGALSAAAAIGALALALGQLAPHRRRADKAKAAARPMMLDAPRPVPPARPQPQPEPFPRAPEPKPEPPAAAVLAEIVREPLRRLDLAIMSRRAPERLRVPVGLARGRILELNLPLLVANAGETALADVSIHVVLPNEITYGASLERLSREAPAGLPGAITRYALSEHETRIRIDVPRLEPGVMASVPVPISIKHAAEGAYPIVAIAFAEGLAPVERRYELELMDPASMIAPASSREAWVCRPDEISRERDPHLPLDRICSMEFQVAEPATPPAAPVRAEPAYASAGL